MKKILLLSFFTFVASFSHAQTFTFECYCGDLSGARCDICTGQTQTRFFCGLLVKKSGTVVKWIDAPYIVQWQGNNAVIKEIIPNPESIVINLSGTSFANLAAFKAALECPCNVPGKLFYISDSTKFARVIRGDTVTIVGNGGATVTLDTTNQKFIVTAAASAAQVLSATGAGPTQYNIALSGGGGAVVLKEGASINLTRSNDTITIANTSPDQTVTITGGGINVVTGTYPNYTITGTEIDGVTTNEGVLGVGAGGAASSVLLSNTSGASGVTINAAGINTISETTSSNGGQITITGTEVDGSTTNELQNLSLTGQALGISSGTGVTLPVINVSAGTGISVSSSAGNYTVTNTGDLSNTNELQTISNTSDATSHTATLSNSGGSVKLVEGSNITLTTTGTTSDGIITIAAASAGPGGIYGGSGSLPSGGSIVTTNGYPLGFTTNTSSGTERTILNMSSPYASDDAFTIWMRGVAGTALKDSFKLYNFDQQTHLYASGNLNLFSDNTNIITGDSIQAATVQAITKMPAVVGITAGGVLKKMVGTSNGQALLWNNGGWAPGTVSSTGITGSGTSGQVTYWNGASTVTGSNNFQFNGTSVGIGGAPISGFGLYSTTATRTDGAGIHRGAGSITSSTAASYISLWNTTVSTGDTWRVGSENNGSFDIISDNLGDTLLSINATGNMAYYTTPDAAVGLRIGLDRPLGIPLGATANRNFNRIPGLWNNTTLRNIEAKIDSAGAAYKTILSYASPTVTKQAAMGSTGTVTKAFSSNDKAGQLTLVISGTGITNGALVNVAYVGTYASVPFVSLTARNAAAAGQATNLFVGTQTTSNFTINANTALAAGTYIINYQTQQ